MKLSIVTTLLTVLLLFLSGCLGGTPTPNDQEKIDKTLPIISLTKNGIITDMKTVAFEWKSITDPRVNGVYIYKKSPDDKELQYYKTITTRYSTHYVDRDVEPGKKYLYAFRTFSEKSQGINSKVFSVKTLPVLQSVSWIHSIGGLPRIAKIIWRPHISERVDTYVIERKTLADDEWDEVKELSGRLNAEYIDEGLEDNRVYFYRIRVKTYDDIISAPSKVVRSVTKQLPKTIPEIFATKKLPKKIKIRWPQTMQKDFNRYYLYRSDDIDGEYELIAKLYNNTFTDEIDEDGKHYFYRVAAVDKDGLESIHDNVTVMGMTLEKPAAPAILEAKLLGKEIVLKWEKNDPRTVSYIVERRAKKGWFDEVKKEFKGIRKNSFIDKHIESDTLYKYRVYSVDKHAIVSEPSMEVEIKTPLPTTQISQEEKNIAPYVAEEKNDTTKVVPVEELDLNGL